MNRILEVIRGAANTARSWRVVGTLYSTGLPAKVEWKDGRLTGGVDAIRDIDKLVVEGQVAVTPTGPFMEADKTDETSAYLMAVAVMQDPDVSGDTPVVEIPEIPEDAVA